MINNNSIVSRFVRAIKEYGFILNKDFGEIINIVPHKREVFVNNGVKMFLRKVVEEMEIFHLNIQHYVDTKPTEALIGIIVSIHIYRDENISEYIVFNPVNGYIFYTDKNKVYFNERIISFPMKNQNGLILDSSSSLFLHNLYPCYMINGAFSQIFIKNEHLERNKYSINLLKKVEGISLKEEALGLKITNYLK